MKNCEKRMVGIDMKNTKRGLSLLLIFALLFATVGIGIGSGKIGTQLSKADVVSKTTGPSPITFYVPETIYLKPVTGNATQFQYYADSSTSGALNNTYNKTSGVVYFKCDGASSVTISASGASVSLGSSTSSSGTLSTTVTAGTMTAGVSEGNVSTVTWTATYVVNNEIMTAKAYSVAYSPLVEPVASAIRTYNSDGSSSSDKAHLHTFTYVTGIHSVSGGTHGVNRTASDHRYINPMEGKIGTPNNNSVEEWINTSAIHKGTNFKNREGGGNNIVVIHNSPTGYITVDRSRYSDINQIPNLRYGLTITDTNRMRDDGYWFVSDYTSGTYRSDDDENKDGGNINNWWGTNGSAGDAGIIKDGSHNSNVGVSNGIKVGGQTGKQMFSKALTAGIGTQDLVVKGAAKMRNSGEWNATCNLVNVKFTKVDKGTLRNNVRTHINKGLQAADYSAGYSAYEAEIKAAAERLGDPRSANTSDTLQAKFNALTVRTYTATVKHNFDTNKASITETQNFNSGDKINFGPNSYTGYTLNSASGVTTSLSPQTVIRRENFTQNYNYKGHTYTVTYNGNGHTGGSTANSSHTYDVARNLTSNGFNKTGHSFKGWNTAANGSGTSYTNGQSVTNLTSSNGATVTLYAQWEVNQYTITFNSNGGSAVAAIKKDYGTQIPAPTAPTKAGQNFAGWYSDSGLTNPVSWPHTITANATFYAKWEAATADVFFNANGGSGTMTKQTINIGATVALKANTFTPPTGHSFKNWNTQSDGDGTTYGDQANITMGSSDLTLYAQWSVNNYNLTFNANGGTGGTGPTATPYGSNISAPTVSRTGYSFKGWNPTVPATMPAAHSTYTAQWQINQYTITFNSAGGTAVAAITQDYDTAVTAPANPTKEGHTFAGWSSPVPAKMPAENITLTAQWTVNKYTVSFDTAGGSTAPVSITEDYGTAITPPADPTKTGHSFKGWNPAVPATMPAQNVTCVAQWEVNQYTITFDSNGGSAVTAITQDYNSSVANPSDPTRTGYSFDGWYFDEGLENAVTWPYTMDDSNPTFYAKWQGDAHTITFDANGGIGGETVNLNYGDPLTPPTVRRTGYAFQGWNPGVPATVDGDKTYVAQWAKTSVNVSLTEEGEIAVAITGYSLDYNYQIWTYQKITSDIILDDDPDIPANQWILSMGYTLGSYGDEEDNALFFYIDQFTSPNDNYTIALRIADENGDYLFELRDSYTPEDLNEAVITKVLVDGEYVKGSAQADGDGHSSTRVVKEIKPGATTTLKVVGNDAVTGYTATVYETGQELTVSNDNEFIWDISGLEPRNYSVKVTAKNGNSEDKRTIHFTLYSLAYSDYVEIDTLDVAGGGVYADPNQNITITPDFTNSNGYFFYRIHEPGRKAQITNGNFTTLDPIIQPMEKYGYYQLTGLVNRTSGLLNPGYDDGIIKFFNMKRNADASSLAVTTKSGGATVNTSNPVAKGTALRIEGSASIAGIGSTPVQYSFWRYDAKGYILVKDWSSDNFLDWTPGKVGVYNIEVRAKGEDAGSYEVHKSISLTITYTGEPMAEGVDISIELGSSSVKARVPIVVSANATSSNSEDLLYKFYVHDEFMKTRTLQNYSANQECLWTPRKAGTYDIMVLVKNQNSYGKYDAIKKVTVNVVQ